MGRNKRYKRKSEFTYEEAEFLTTIAEDFGFKYPTDELQKGWEMILLNQFHDILPGSAIKEV